jgi:dihydrolipoamide dehydrogenase
LAAVRTRQLGLKVALLKKAYLVGVFLNRGYIPTKNLLRDVEVLHLPTRVGAFGFIFRISPSIIPRRSASAALW